MSKFELTGFVQRLTDNSLSTRLKGPNFLSFTSISLAGTLATLWYISYPPTFFLIALLQN